MKTPSRTPTTLSVGFLALDAVLLLYAGLTWGRPLLAVAGGACAARSLSALVMSFDASPGVYSSGEFSLWIRQVRRAAMSKRTTSVEPVHATRRSLLDPFLARSGVTPTDMA